MPKDDYASAALLERWITQYGDMLVRLAYGMLRDRTLCQDAAQDTLLKAWRGYHTFRGECTEKTYLTGILMNTCRDYLRTAWMRRIDRRFTPDTLPKPYADAAPRDRTVIEAATLLARTDHCRNGAGAALIARSNQKAIAARQRAAAGRTGRMVLR